MGKEGTRTAVTLQYCPDLGNVCSPYRPSCRTERDTERRSERAWRGLKGGSSRHKSQQVKGALRPRDRSRGMAAGEESRPNGLHWFLAHVEGWKEAD